MLEEQELVTYNGEKYIIVAVAEKNNKTYAFANRLDYLGTEPTDEYSIFTENNGRVGLVIDNQLIQELLPVFQQKVRSEIFNMLGNKEVEVMSDDNN